MLTYRAEPTAGPLRILLVAEGDDYGDPTRGKSYCYYNLLLPLRARFPDVLHFDFIQRYRRVGKREMNRELLELVERAQPDVAIFALYTDEFVPAVLDRITRISVTVAYFFDDIWRRAWADRWARHFCYVTSGLRAGVRRFQASGVRGVVHSTYGINADLYRPLGLAPEHDVSFVGIYHPHRAWLIDALREAGHRVAVFGHRWPAGRVTIEEMVRVFNTTRVNLNLSNAVHWDARYLLDRPESVLWNIKIPKDREYLKSRHFELAGCGAFQLSYDADLEGAFVPGREIATFTGRDDLVAKVAYYLAHPQERDALSAAARARAVAEYTAQNLLEQLVREVHP